MLKKQFHKDVEHTLFVLPKFAIFTIGVLMLQIMSLNAQAQMVPGCARAADEATRVETARSILRVNARVDPVTGQKDVDHYYKVINYWAEDAVYKETVLTNHSRAEMWEYLDNIYQMSPDMVLEIEDEVWKTNPDGSMTYMATNKWYGNWEGYGPYVQPGMSIVKFDPGEGCASYQRDYFSEGDTWWGMPQAKAFVNAMRIGYIYAFGLSGRCFDEDGDGYSKYPTFGCPYAGVDCNDYVASMNPGVSEIPGNGLDDNCDGYIDTCYIDTDNDGICDANDNCPTEINGDQTDFDNDGIGDVCDADADADGVMNSSDMCSETPLGEVIDFDSGCSIAQLCPCEGPSNSTSAWKNHGQYVSCVASEAKDFVHSGLLTKREAASLRKTASQSDCGK